MNCIEFSLYHLSPFTQIFFILVDVQTSTNLALISDKFFTLPLWTSVIGGTLSHGIITVISFKYLVHNQALPGEVFSLALSCSNASYVPNIRD